MASKEIIILELNLKKNDSVHLFNDIIDVYIPLGKL